MAGEDRPSTAGPILGATRYVPPLHREDSDARRRNSEPTTAEEASTAAEIAANAPQEYSLLDENLYSFSPGNSRPTSPSSYDKALIDANFEGPGPEIKHVDDRPVSGIEESPKLARETSSSAGEVKKQKRPKYMRWLLKWCGGKKTA